MARGKDAWQRWYRRWEEQQETFNPTREARFSAMLDVLAATVPPRFTALDLGCGPGALSARLLRRFPKARCVAVDFDPVVLRVGQGALGTFGGRLRWVDQRIGTPGWERALPQRRFDAAVSTTALHWLEPGPLRRLYADLGRLIRPGGVVLNGDRLPWGPKERDLSRLAEKVRRVRLRGRRRNAGWASWDKWWADAAKDPELGPLFPERARRHSQHPSHDDSPLENHRRALRRGGFRTVEVVWRDLENSVLFAQR